MSRGYSIKLNLTDDRDGVSKYAVFASGWDQPKPDRLMGEVEIDRNMGAWNFTPYNEWSKEIFYIPTYEELQVLEEGEVLCKPLNKNYGWWNGRLLNAVNRVLTKEEYKERVWFYQ